jgi:Uma2 family endonuclease
VEGAFVDDDSETIPDLAVRERITPPPARWDDVPRPILIIEVTSESTRRYDEVKKRAFYMESGIPEYWIVDGATRTIRIVTSAGDRTEAVTLRWQPFGTAAVLELDLPTLFAEALGTATA